MSTICSHCRKLFEQSKLRRHHHRTKRCVDCSAHFDRILLEQKEEVMTELRKLVAEGRKTHNLWKYTTTNPTIFVFGAITFSTIPRGARWKVGDVQQVWTPKKDCDSHVYFDSLYGHTSFYKQSYYCRQFAKGEMIALLALRKRVPLLGAIDRNIFRLIFRCQLEI